MLQKGAIAGKMMGSQWFAYSKYRGDWQNLSVCKNLDDPIQFVRTRRFCVGIHQKPSRELPPRHHSYLAVAGTRAQNIGERKTKWAIRNMGKHRNLESRGGLCCHVDRHYYVIMGWWHVVTTGAGQWSVTPCGHTTHCPVTRGSHGVTCASQWPLSLCTRV